MESEKRLIAIVKLNIQKGNANKSVAMQNIAIAKKAKQFIDISKQKVKLLNDPWQPMPPYEVKEIKFESIRHSENLHSHRIEYTL